MLLFGGGSKNEEYNNFGSSVGIQVYGAETASTINFGVGFNVAALGTPRADAEQWLAENLRTLEKAVGDKVYDLGKAAGTNPDPIKHRNGTIPQPEQYGQSSLNPISLANTIRLSMPLTEVIKPLGLVLSLSLDFPEDATLEGNNIHWAGARNSAYKATIGGVMFNKVCSAVGTAGAVSGRHGLETILEYFGRHRISNTGKAGRPDVVTQLKIGLTLFTGYVTGLEVSPLNMEYMLWDWKLHLAIDPRYVPQSMESVGATLSGRRLQSTGLPQVGAES